MPRETRVTGHYVRLDPDNWFRPGDMDRERAGCNSIAADIRRRVGGIKSVSIETESEEVCEFCGSPWREHGNTFNGGCCDDDRKHEPPEE